ncbi:PKS-NRPS hybrid synthetase [Trifolium repens]|nr:PKS-NRPS hybrid synthetase [Trifolium repens]
MAQTGNTGQMLVDTTYIFTTDEKFDTRDAVLKWARKVGDANKVSIIITRSDKKIGVRGRNDKLILGCDKGGKYDSSGSSTTSASKKCNCPFKIRTTPSTDGSGWKVHVKCGLHNHGLPDQYAGHPRKARLTADESKRVEDLTKKRDMLQKQERGPRTKMQHLLQWLDDAKYVTWNRRRNDGSDVLSDIFWAHPESIKLLNLFPIVLVMDCTYKTNKYRQPLLQVQVIGITSTDLTFAVGFSYMESEKTDNYRWALEKLRELFIKKDIFPQVILTVRELALMNAIEIVFPHSVNMLCTWHIYKNVFARISVHVPKDMRELLQNLWRNVVSSQNEVEFQQRLNKLDQACVNSNKFVDYINNIWLTPHKERFVHAWTNKVMHLGNTTTNRVESAHWKLKQMLENSKGDLYKCLKSMNDNIILQIGSIKASFQKSFYYTEHLHSGPFFSNLRSFVSREAMTLISEEFAKVGIVGTDKNICGCTLRSTCGLPCACELGRYTLSSVPIPLDSVHDIVGKRALKSKVFELAYPTTSSLCPPPEQIKTRGGVKKNDRGKAPKGYDVYREPSYFEHVERETTDSQGSSKKVCTQASQSSQKQQRMSSQNQQSQSSQKQLSQPSKKQQYQTSKKLISHKYLVQFPKHLIPHIIDVIEIVGDGNCGFRAIASLLGYTEDGWPMVRRELGNELRSNISLYEKIFGQNIQRVRDSLQISGLGDQLEDKWFTIPVMGYLVANMYNVILVTLGKPSKTFFPMMTSYSASARFFCIGYVGGNHWVQVNMKQGFPLPEVMPEWKKCCSSEALSWITNLNGRLQY